MVERTISTQVRGVEGGVDSINGLSTTTLAAAAPRCRRQGGRALQERYPLVSTPDSGPCLGGPPWRGAGGPSSATSSTPPSPRAASSRASRPRRRPVRDVSPYVKDGLTSVADVRGALDAVDLCVSPRSSGDRGRRPRRPGRPLHLRAAGRRRGGRARGVPAPRRRRPAGVRWWTSGCLGANGGRLLCFFFFTVRAV